MAMAALASQVKFETAVFAIRGIVPREGHPLLDQPLDGLVAVLDRETDGVFAAQPSSGDEGVGDM